MSVLRRQAGGLEGLIALEEYLTAEQLRAVHRPQMSDPLFELGICAAGSAQYPA